MEIRQGDILDVNHGIIVHQVNTLGVMGAGLALQIKEKYPIAFKDYSGFSSIYSDYQEELLGLTLLTKVEEDLYIAHMFAQSSIGVGKTRTNYDAFNKSLENLKVVINRESYHELPIYFPYKIGCGLGGGDWGGVIKPLINKYFPKATIVKL